MQLGRVVVGCLSGTADYGLLETVPQSSTPAVPEIFVFQPKRENGDSTGKHFQLEARMWWHYVMIIRSGLGAVTAAANWVMATQVTAIYLSKWAAILIGNQ